MTLGIDTVVILLVVMGIACGFGGYAIAIAGQRRAGNGKTAAELKTEISDYKENVAEHFQTTAGLLHDMTEQYRSVYEHMAAGAQQLCDAEQATSQIESLRAGLLPVIEKPLEDEEASNGGTEGETEQLLDATDESLDSIDATSVTQDGEELGSASEDQLEVRGDSVSQTSDEVDALRATDDGDEGETTSGEVPSDDQTATDKA